MLIFTGIFLLLNFFSLCELCHGFSNRQKKVIIAVFSLFFAVLSAIYSGQAGDFNFYKAHFELVTVKNLFTVTQNQFEYLYEVLNVLIRQLTPHYSVLRFVFALFVMALWYQIYFKVRKQDSGKYALTAFYAVWALQSGHIFTIRSTAAIALCIYSIRYIKSKSVIKFLLLTAVAVFIHYMSVMWFPAYLIYHSRFRLRFFYAGIAAIAALSRKIPDILRFAADYMPGQLAYKVTYYLGYGITDTYGNYYGYGIQLVKALANNLLLVIVFQYIVYQKRKKDGCREGDTEKFFRLFLFGIMIYIAAFSTSLAMSRAATLYTFVQFLLLPEIFDLDIVKRPRENRFFVLFVFSMYLYLRMAVQLKANGCLPFITIFEGR